MKKYRLKEDAERYMEFENGKIYSANKKKGEKTVAQLVKAFPYDWEEVPEENPNHTVLGAKQVEPIDHVCTEAKGVITVILPRPKPLQSIKLEPTPEQAAITLLKSLGYSITKTY